MIDFDKLDRVIHERGRLSIVTLLAARPDWSFADLGAELGMSDGNLITHLRALGKAGYVSVEKRESGGRRRSHYELTPEGNRAFRNYLALLEELVASARNEP